MSQLHYTENHLIVVCTVWPSVLIARLLTGRPGFDSNSDSCFYSTEIL